MDGPAHLQKNELWYGHMAEYGSENEHSKTMSNVWATYKQRVEQKKPGTEWLYLYKVPKQEKHTHAVRSPGNMYHGWGISREEASAVLVMLFLALGAGCTGVFCLWKSTEQHM